MINSETILPQETITLSKGEHTIQISEEPGVYTLRWGNNLYRPEEVKRKSRVFNGF